MYEPGTRVVAVSHSEGGTLCIFGHGVYEGDFAPPNMVDIQNPRIKLDSGKTVWGYECWWGDEAWFDSVKAFGSDLVNKIPYMIVEIDIDEAREKDRKKTEVTTVQQLWPSRVLPAISAEQLTQLYYDAYKYEGHNPSFPYDEGLMWRLADAINEFLNKSAEK